MIFTAMKIHVEDFWILTVFIDVAGYCFGVLYCFHLHPVD